MPEVGATFKAREAIGAPGHGLVAGQSVTVRNVTPHGEDGAGDHGEDAIVVEWGEPTVVQGESGPEIGSVQRAFSVGVSEFDALFEEA